MMSFKIAFLNIRKSFKDYSIYFLTLTLGIVLFYAFNSIESQQAMFEIKESSIQAIKMFSQVIGGVSIFISIILACLIIYANNFLIKRRKKEFGIYLTLGMEKMRVMKILLIETFIVGFLSIVIGSLIGIFLSQGMALVSAALFETKVNEFVFVFSPEALRKTVLYFSITFILVSVFNIISVYRQKLIKLISAKRINENIKVRNSIIASVLIVLSFVSLGTAYFLLLRYGLIKSFDEGLLFIEMALGGIGTFLFFAGFSGFFLKVIQANKKMYFKNLNTFITRQISGRINTNIISMSIISLLLFMTISILSAGTTMRNILNTFDDASGIHDVRFNSFSKNEEGIAKRLEIYAPEGMKLIDKFAEFNLYFSNVLYNDIDENQSKTKMFAITISDLNNINKSVNKQLSTLEKGEIGIAYQDENGEQSAKHFMKKNPTLNGLKVKEIYDLKKIAVTFTAKNMFLVYPDESINDIEYFERAMIAFYKGNKENSERKIIEIIDEKLRVESPSEGSKENGKELNPLSGIYYQTRFQIISEMIGMKATVIFVSIYLGLIFLLACAAILALQQLSEAQDNKERYQVLSKIGVDSNMLNKALFKQIGIYFIIPLVVAIVHSIFGISALNKMIVEIEKTETLTAMLYTSAFILIVYGSYFFTTYFGAKKIISEYVREQ